MNRTTVAVLLLLILVILVGAPVSFARPQYLTNLTAMYGNGSCSTCHVIAPGGGGTRNSNGTFGPRNSNRTLPRNSYGTLFENQPNHAIDPSAALIAIGPPPTATPTPADTAVKTSGIQAAPGFEIVVSLVGLFAGSLLARRHNK